MKGTIRMKRFLLAGLIVASGGVCRAQSLTESFERAVGMDQAAKRALARAQSQRSASADVFESVQIAEKPGAGEIPVKKDVVPDDLDALLRGLSGKSFSLVRTLHSAPAGFACSLKETVHYKDEATNYSATPVIVLWGDPMQEEYEMQVDLGGPQGLRLSFPLGVALNKATDAILQVNDGKATHYRIVSDYWADVASPIIIGRDRFTNEFDVWTEGGRVYFKQKHRFSANGVPSRSKECLFAL